MAKPILQEWPREKEHAPFDAAAWNSYANFMNGFLSGPMLTIDTAENEIWHIDNETPEITVSAPFVANDTVTANGAVTLGDAAGDAVSILGTATFTPLATFTGGLVSTGPLTANGAVTLGDAAADAVAILGTATFTPLATFAGGIAISAGNLAFAATGSAQRILADFSAATVANRLMLQTSTVNGITDVSAIPNGSGDGAAYSLFSTPTPTASARLIAYAATSDHYLISDHIGASYLPLNIMAGGLIGLKLQANGDLIVGSGTAKKVGFYGSAGAGQGSVGAAATDPASTQTLANNLRTLVRDLGLSS